MSMKHESITRIAAGSRKAVLMIHGIAGSPGHFEPLLPAVPEDWSLYSILLDGHGGTVRDFSATTMKKWRSQVAQQVNDLLTQYDVLILAAHSMGTLFAIQAAIDHPERIRGLLLLASPLRIHLPPATVLGGLHLAAGKAQRHKVAAAMEGDSSIRHEGKFFSYFGWTPRFAELLAEITRVRKLLPGLTVPCRIFQSRKDELVSLRALRDISRCEAMTLTVLENSGHFTYSETDAGLLCDALSQLLQS